MLTLSAPQAQTLWDEFLPVEATELPEDLAKLDELLGGSGETASETVEWHMARARRPSP